MSDKVERESPQDIVRHASRVPTKEPSSHAAPTITVSDNHLTFSGPDWTLRWAAPELLIKNERPGLASDIWSAGWVCWEVRSAHTRKL